LRLGSPGGRIRTGPDDATTADRRSQTGAASGNIRSMFVEPFVEAEGEPSNKPQRPGEPLEFYIRHEPAADADRSSHEPR